MADRAAARRAKILARAQQSVEASVKDLAASPEEEEEEGQEEEQDSPTVTANVDDGGSEEDQEGEPQSDPAGEEDEVPEELTPAQLAAKRREERRQRILTKGAERMAIVNGERPVAAPAPAPDPEVPSLGEETARLSAEEIEQRILAPFLASDPSIDEGGTSGEDSASKLPLRPTTRGSEKSGPAPTATRAGNRKMAKRMEASEASVDALIKDLKLKSVPSPPRAGLLSAPSVLVLERLLTAVALIACGIMIGMGMAPMARAAAESSRHAREELEDPRSALEGFLGKESARGDDFDGIEGGVMMGGWGATWVLALGVRFGAMFLFALLRVLLRLPAANSFDPVNTPSAGFDVMGTVCNSVPALGKVRTVASALKVAIGDTALIVVASVGTVALYSLSAPTAFDDVVEADFVHSSEEL